jgi:hypothetical protein
MAGFAVCFINRMAIFPKVAFFGFLTGAVVATLRNLGNFYKICNRFFLIKI